MAGQETLSQKWDKIAEDIRGDPSLSRYLESIKLIKERGTALDLGCGQGLLSKCLIEAGFQEVIGLDISRTLAKMSTRYLENIVVADVHKLPFKTDSVDFVFALDSIEHWRNPLKGALEAKRVCKKKIVISTPSFFFTFMQKLHLFEFGCSIQPIDKPVSPRVLQEFCDKSQESYFTKFGPAPLILFQGIARKYLSRVTTTFSGTDLQPSKVVTTSSPKKSNRFPTFRYVFLCSEIWLLINAK